MAKKSVCAKLNESLGGTWKYVPFQAVWQCDDNQRYICGEYSTSFGMFDDDDHDRIFRGYFLHGDGTPKPAEDFMYDDVSSHMVELHF